MTPENNNKEFVNPNKERSVGFSDLRDTIKKVNPYLLTGRENRFEYDPEIEINNYTKLDIKVDEKALLAYIRGLEFEINIGGILIPATVHDRLDSVAVDFHEDHYISKPGEKGLLPEFMFGRALIEVIIDPLSRDSRGDINPYKRDTALALMLDDDELDWAAGFWESYDPNDNEALELDMNWTLFHEIKHIEHGLFNEMVLLEALRIAGNIYGEKTFLISEAWKIAREIQEKFEINEDERELEAEAYAVRVLKLHIDQGLPKPISLK